MDISSFLSFFQVERLEEGNPGKLKVTGKYNDGTEFVDEFNTVSGGLNYSCRILGRVAQSVTCLATDASLTADPGVASSIPAQSHSCVEIDHEIISMVILLPSAESFKKGCCQLQAKVCARSTC